MQIFLNAGLFGVPAVALAAAVGAAASIVMISLHADLHRRRIRMNPFAVACGALVAWFAGAWLGLRIGFGPAHIVWYGGLAGGLLALLALAWLAKIPTLEFLDACSTAAAAGYAIAEVGRLLITGGYSGIRAPLGEFLVWLVIAATLWRMGSTALRTPRPRGEIFSTFLILAGAERYVHELIRSRSAPFFALTDAKVAALAMVLAGGVLLWLVKSRFHKVKREHRVLDHTASLGSALQPEYHSPTPECPHPERWHMYDSISAEAEVLDFLKALIVAVKPELVVETGTFMGLSTLRIAEGLKENGFGRVITCESDPKVFAAARERFDASGLAPWIDARNESSLEMKIEGCIDLLFCDSDQPLREQEVRRFLPQVNPHGLVLIHDADSKTQVVREGALRLEQECLLSVVMLSTPRGLVIAQKRAGRS